MNLRNVKIQGSSKGWWHKMNLKKIKQLLVKKLPTAVQLWMLFLQRGWWPSAVKRLMYSFNFLLSTDSYIWFQIRFRFFRGILYKEEQKFKKVHEPLSLGHCLRYLRNPFVLLLWNQMRLMEVGPSCCFYQVLISLLFSSNDQNKTKLNKDLIMKKL